MCVLPTRILLWLAVVLCGSGLLPGIGPLQARGSQPAPTEPTVLGIADTRFTINGAPTFLLGCSYYGGLGAPRELLVQDLDDAQRLGFNWLRVWATWESYGDDVSAVDAAGHPREPYLNHLQCLVAECDRRRMVVDVTLTRGREIPGAIVRGRLRDLPAHAQAVTTLITALRAHRNWYLDLANERDVRDERFVSPEELQQLRRLVRELDPQRLVTASFGGHDLSEQDLRDALVIAELDFLCPHRPRHPKSPAETEARTRECLALQQQQLGRQVPVHYQEPFRRGYGLWNPTAADYLTDLGGAKAGGAAGWCFHNGSTRRHRNQEPRRSFDLRTVRLFDQLDTEEQQFVRQLLQPE